MPTQQEIRDFICLENASHDVVIWSKSYCPFCSAAKHLFTTKLSAHVSDVVVHEIDQHEHGRLIQLELMRMTGQRTVPNIFVNNQHVGGNDNVQGMYQNGTLVKLLETSQKTERDSGSSLSTATSSSDISRQIQAEIEDHDVVIFSKSYCPYCQATKKLIASELPTDTDVMVYELDQMANGPQLQDTLFRLTGQRTVPNVFIQGEHIGGNDDTHAVLADKHRSGEIVPSALPV